MSMLQPRAAVARLVAAAREAHMFPAFTELTRVELTLYTDALVTRGWLRTRQHRVTDILNLAEQPFLVLENVVVEELGDRGEPIRADVAQVNLDAVLFA